jgi:threonine dehydrogenase-like Zn-dependent dehydrogenase
VADVAEPELRRGEVLVAPAFSAISAGTELWLLDGSADPDFGTHEYPPDPPSWPTTRSPIRRHHPLPREHVPGRYALGYSLAGEVVAVDDDIVDVEVGDLVACSGSQCAHHAERVAVPRNMVAPVPDGVDLADAAFVTLGSIATTGLRATGCQFGETIVVYGLGLLGLLAGQIGVAAGYRIIGIDIEPARLDLARELGIDDVLDAETTAVVEAVHELTAGFGADAILLGVKSDSSEPLNLAFDMCRQGARVIAQGLFGFTVDRHRLYANQVSVHPAIGYGVGRYDPVYEEGNVDFPIGLARWTGNRNQQYFLDLLRRRRVDVGPLAPHRIPFERAAEAYDLLRRPDRPPTVILSYGREDDG